VSIAAIFDSPYKNYRGRFDVQIHPCGLFRELFQKSTVNFFTRLLISWLASMMIKNLSAHFRSEFWKSSFDQISLAKTLRISPKKKSHTIFNFQSSYFFFVLKIGKLHGILIHANRQKNLISRSKQKLNCSAKRNGKNFKAPLSKRRTLEAK
jgi:hypothetical protein